MRPTCGISAHSARPTLRARQVRLDRRVLDCLVGLEDESSEVHSALLSALHGALHSYMVHYMVHHMVHCMVHYMVHYMHSTGHHMVHYMHYTMHRIVHYIVHCNCTVHYTRWRRAPASIPPRWTCPTW